MKKFFLIALSLLFVGTAGNTKVNVANDDPKTPDGVVAVDLGLSVKWANRNVGATKDSGFGSYFAWGEIKPKQYYSWGTYVWSKNDTQFLVKYSATDRMIDEYEELINNCKWEWTTKDGVNGYKITSKKNGNSIFMPITGFRFYEGVQFRAFKGIYWTSTVYGGNPVKSWCLEFDFEKIDVTFGSLSSNRVSGRCVRAVK